MDVYFTPERNEAQIREVLDEVARRLGYKPGEYAKTAEQQAEIIKEVKKIREERAIKN